MNTTNHKKISDISITYLFCFYAQLIEDTISHVKYQNSICGVRPF